jgi:hypothetical protein
MRLTLLALTLALGGLLGLLGLGACGGKSTPAGKAVDPALTSCQVDSDCTLINLECCDSCNGGTSWSVSVRAAGAAKEAHGRPCGEDERCTLLACNPEPQAVCHDNTCMIRRGDDLEYNVR